MIDNSICITGTGLSTCLGLDAEEVWSRVRRGQCGIALMSAMETPLSPGKDGGQAPDLPEDYCPRLPREARYLRWTIESALRSASLDLGGASSDAGRRAVLLGTTLHGMRAGGEFLRSRDPTRLRTFLAGDTARLATEGMAIGGMVATTCSACSSSLGAVALAVTLLERGEVDLVIAGGYDTISEYVWGGFNALRLVSDPPLRPFARGRCGMKVAEGYGIVILERRRDALARGGRPFATIAGWGESADAFHLTRPHPEGAGALAAMRQALARAAIEPQELGLIAAHATGTPDNDSSEAAAITVLTGRHAVPVVGFKSHLGHTLGGAGAVEMILSAMALRDQVLPPTANVDPSEIEYALAVTTGEARHATIRYTLNTSLGFGGANTCVVLRGESVPTTSSRVARPHDADRMGEEVCITGVGVLVPGAAGNDAFLGRLHDNGGARLPRTIADAEFEHLVNARRTRRMSPYVKYSLCAATLACRHAELLDQPDLLREASAILATTHGSAGYSYDYYAQIVREGIQAANPMLFAEGVPNAAAAQLSLMLGLQGACQTIIGTRTAGVDAMRLAAARIASGVTNRVIVAAAEESHPTLDDAYRACPGDGRRGAATCSAAIAFVLEAKSIAVARGARVYATLGNAVSISSASPARLRYALRSLGRSDGRAAPVSLSGRTNPNNGPSRLRVTRALKLEGDLFSVEPFFALAAHLLEGATRASGSARGTARAHLLVATDRSGLASAIRIDPASSLASATGLSAARVAS